MVAFIGASVGGSIPVDWLDFHSRWSSRLSTWIHSQAEAFSSLTFATSIQDDPPNAESPAPAPAPANDPTTPPHPHQRREPRYLAREKAKVTIKLSNSDATPTGYVSDLSLNGLGLMLDGYISSFEEITIKIQFGTNTFEVAGAVAWTMETPTSGKIIKENSLPWRVGVALKHATVEQKQNAQMLLDKLAKK